MSFVSGSSKKYLFLSILGLFVLFVIFKMASIFNQEQYPIIGEIYSTDILFIILPILVIIFGTYLSIKNRLKGNHGKAWVFFTFAILSMLFGETTYSYDSEIDPEDVSTLTSDVFYMLFYPLFFIFTIFYLKPRRRIISKNIIIAASIASVIFVIPSLYLAIGIDNELSNFELVFYGLYPILDGIILVPSIIAVILFFRGQVNLLWAFLLFASFTDVTADTIYLVMEVEDSYELGSSVDVLFLWSYVLYALGVWSYIQVYKNSKKQDHSLFS